MNRLVPRLTAALCVLALRASASTVEQSNRTPATPEPQSNWIRVYTVRPGPDAVGQDKPFFAMSYWCHKTDCDMRETGTNKNPAHYGGGMGNSSTYREGIRIYTLLPKDVEGEKHYFRAVPAPWGLEISQYSIGGDVIMLRAVGKTGLFDDAAKLWVSDAKLDKSASLGKYFGFDEGAKVFVDNDEAIESGQPLPLGFQDEGAACTPAGYDQYYGSAWNADQGKADRFFMPIEFELEKANLGVGVVMARVHSGTYNDQPFSGLVDAVKSGESMLFADRFVKALRPPIRAAAQFYYDSNGGNNNPEFSPFEKRFIHCRMGFAGLSSEFFNKVVEGQANPGIFVNNWRRFIREEMKHYTDEQTPPPGPLEDWQSYDPKFEWDEMVSRTNQWLKDGKITQAAAVQQQTPAKTQTVAAKPQEPPAGAGKISKEKQEELRRKQQEILDSIK